MAYSRCLIMKNKPRIRFKGFTEDWEQREFSDIFAEIKSGLSRMLSNDDIGLPVVRANNINDGQLNLVDDIKYWYKNDPQGANTNNYLIEQGDILINFINSEAKMGTAAYVTRKLERDTIYTTNILRCKVNDEYNPYFIYSLTFLNSYKNYIASITKPAVNQASFTTVDFKKYSTKIPIVKEQKQIADLIETFNKLITLHQRKLEKLKLAKKALLQKLFPKNGSKFPELRFKGFADAWEQRKLGDIADVRDGTHDSPKFYNDGFPLVTSKNLKDGSIDFSDCSFISEQDFDEINKRSKVDPGDILFGMIGTIGKPAIVEHTGFAIKNVALIKEGNIINNRFIYHLLSSKVFDDYIARENAGGTQKFIALNQIRNFIFSAPTLPEQNKIIELLDYISQTITLHQRKLDKLQEVKKGLLQKMFV